MTDTKEEAEWRAEFERFGEQQTAHTLRSGVFPEPKRQFAFRWLGDQAQSRTNQEAETIWYAKWTFYAAVAAVAVGVVGILIGVVGVVMTLLH
jgi:hypothetical protein